MPDGNGATVDVEKFVRDAQLVAAIQHLHRERLVELPQADVADLQAGALQQARNGKDRADAHLVRLAACHGEAAEQAQGRNAAFFRQFGVHQNADGRSVAELAGVAGGDRPTRRHRPDLADPFQRGVGADAFIGGNGHFLAGDMAARLVHHAHHGGHGDDLVGELARGLRGRGALLAAGAVGILVLPGNAITLGHLLSRLQHVPVDLGLDFLHGRIAPHMHIDLVLHTGNAFDTTGHHHRRLVDNDAMRRHGDRLQPRGAEAVDRDTTRGDRQSCAQCRNAGHIPAGGAFQQRSAEDHVLHLGGIDARALNCVLDRMRSQRGRVGHVEGTLPALGQAGAGCGDNGNVGHGVRCPRGCQLKVLPCSASWSSKGAGSHDGSASGSAANRFRARTTLGSPTVSAYSIGPPRCRGNP